MMNKAIKYAFGTYAILCFVSGCTGAYHHFYLAGICLVLSAAFWAKDKKEKGRRNTFFD